MKKYWVLFFVLLLTNSKQSLSEEILFINAQVFNPLNLELQNTDLLVTDGKISEIGKKLATGNHQTIDVAGQLLLPGMIDMHTHGWGNASLRTSSDYQYIGLRGTANAMLYAGVHGWLDLFNDEDKILNYRNQQYPMTRQEAYVFAAGPCFTATNGHCSQFGTPTRIIDSPADVEKQINALQPKRPDVLKVVYHTDISQPTINKATLAAFINKAKEVAIPSVVHVGNWQDVRTAASLGASAVTHIPWTAMPEDIAPLMAKNETAIIPTVGLISELMLLKQSNTLPPRAQALTEKLVDQKLLAQFPINNKNPKYQQWLEKDKQQQALTHMQNSLTQLMAAGVKLLIGSDAANEAMYQGIGFHRELSHLQALGVSSKQLLLAATAQSYQFLKLDWGIKVGAPANFILLNPLVVTDINYSTDIQAIYLLGKKVKREPLLQYAKPGWWQYSKLFLGFED